MGILFVKNAVRIEADQVNMAYDLLGLALEQVVRSLCYDTTHLDELDQAFVASVELNAERRRAAPGDPVEQWLRRLPSGDAIGDGIGVLLVGIPCVAHPIGGH